VEQVDTVADPVTTSNVDQNASSVVLHELGKERGVVGVEPLVSRQQKLHQRVFDLQLLELSVQAVLQRQYRNSL